jgi:hypothetical protein
MDYQLVLQFRGDDCLNFDAMVSLEDEMQQIVEPIADVDGHDVGSGEMNIFILTADPVATFERAKALLSASSMLDKVNVAYRELRSNDFTVLWPSISTGTFVVA